jgi:putative hydrolase of the HAD superfamily
MQNVIRVVLFDFGGVVAGEGFYQGLREIGKKNGLDPEVFFKTVDALIFETGYLTGSTDEAAFWKTVRERTGITGTDAELKDGILKRFTLRPAMIASVDRLRSQGLIVAMLSDQTNWLDEIDCSTGLFRHFDRVFNSFWIHKSKRDASVFPEVCSALNVTPDEALFVDDNINHIRRAQEQGLQTILFVSIEDYDQRIARMIMFETDKGG